MNKWIYRFCFIVIIIFAIIGSVFLSIVIHELSHRQDLEKHTKDNGELCFFAYPENVSLKEMIFDNYAVGYLLYHYDENATQETKDHIEKYTEKKATIVGAVLIMLVSFCILIEMIRRIKNSEAEEFYEFFNKWMEKNQI